MPAPGPPAKARADPCTAAIAAGDGRNCLRSGISRAVRALPPGAKML
jgi:hypothetical protein